MWRYEGRALPCWLAALCSPAGDVCAQRVLLLVLAVFVSMWVLALQYDTVRCDRRGCGVLGCGKHRDVLCGCVYPQDIDKEESDESFSVTATTILTNGFVAACINLPVQKLLAALMYVATSHRQWHTYSLCQTT